MMVQRRSTALGDAEALRFVSIIPWRRAIGGRCPGGVVGILLLAVLCGHLGPAGATESRRNWAHIANRGRDAVVTIDPDTLEVVATISVGPGLRPGRIAVSRHGTLAATVNETADTISLVDLEHMDVEGTVAVDCPLGFCRLADLVFSPDGSLVYVLDRGFDLQRIVVIETASARVIDEVRFDNIGPIGGFDELAISADGRLVYILTADGISVLETRSLSISVWARGSYTDIVAAPTGYSLYAANSEAVVVLDESTSREIVSGVAEYLEISPDGAELFIVKGLPGRGRELSRFDLSEQRVKESIELGEPLTSLQDLVAAPTGELLLALNLTDQSLRIVDLASSAVHRIALPHRPINVAIDPEARRAYVANHGTHSGAPAITTVDLVTFEVRDWFRPSAPVALAGTPDGNTLYVANWLADEVAIVDVRARSVVDRIELTRPVDVVIDESGRVAYVAGAYSTDNQPRGAISLIDIDGSRVVDVVPFSDRPRALVLDSVGERLYVGTGGGRALGSISFVDTRSLRVVDSAPTAYSVVEMAIDESGDRLFAGTYGALLNDVAGGILAVDTSMRDSRLLMRTGGVRGIAKSRSDRTIYATTVFYLDPPMLFAVAANDGSLLDSTELEDAGAIELVADDHALIAEEHSGVVARLGLPDLSKTGELRIGGQLSDLAVLPESGPNSFELLGCMPEFFGRNCGSASGLRVSIDSIGRFADTDGDGIFRFEDLPAGRYVLSVDPICTVLGICYRRTEVIVPRRDFVVIDSMARCPGDCDGFGAVQVDEIVACVSIALEQADVETCISCDRNEDREVSVAELIQSVVSSLEGCSFDRL